MRKISSALLLVLPAFFFQFCSSSKKAAAPLPPVSFDKNIKPVIAASCAPCHITGQGKKRPLDNFASASSIADDILARIQKNPGEHGFMPIRGNKLSDSTIALFVKWKTDGLKE